MASSMTPMMVIPEIRGDFAFIMLTKKKTTKKPVEEIYSTYDVILYIYGKVKFNSCRQC